MQHYSVSQCLLYQHCPRAYWYKYKEKIPTRMHKSAIFGVSLHNTLRHLLTPLIKKTEQRSLFSQEEEVPHLTKQDVITHLGKYWISEGYESKQEEFAYMEKALPVLHTIYEEAYTNKQQGREVFAVEQGFSFHISDTAIITGRIDRIDQELDGTLTIIDYKTGKYAGHIDLKEHMQLIIYLLAAEELFRKTVSNITLYYLIENTYPQKRRSDLNIKKVKAQVLHIISSIEQKMFEATPSENTCLHCDFQKICPFAKMKSL